MLCHAHCSRLVCFETSTVAAGDWFKVERLLKETGGDDVALVNAWTKIGQYYSDRQKWGKAAQYYTQVSTSCRAGVAHTCL